MSIQVATQFTFSTGIQIDLDRDPGVHQLDDRLLGRVVGA